MGIALCYIGTVQIIKKFYPQSFGAISIPEAPYLFITTLQSNIGTSDTSMTLNLGTYKNGTSLTGYNCFTLDTGSATAEYACGTASGTAITSLLRGIDPQNPAATSSALIYAHRRGSDVRITDFPILQILKRLNNGQDAFPSPLLYDTTVSTTTLGTNGNYVASVNYANGIAIQGGVNATTSVQGIVQFATATQTSNGTVQGSTGAFLTAPNWLFNNTSSATTLIPVTNTAGKLSQGFLDLTQSFAFSGAVTFSQGVTFSGVNATTTFNASTTFLNIPRLTNNATPTLTTELVPKSYADSLVPPLFSWIPKPSFYSTTTAVCTVNNSTTAFVGMVNIPGKMLVNKVSIVPPSSITGTGLMRIGLYSEDGQTKVMDVVTASISTAGAVVSTTTTSTITVNPGNYYLAAVRADGTLQVNMNCWSETNNKLNNEISGKAVLNGTMTVSSNVLPATFTPTSLATSTAATLLIRLDN